MKIRFAEIEFDLERVKSEFGRYQDETKKDLILLKSELEKEKSHCETERNKRTLSREREKKDRGSKSRRWGARALPPIQYQPWSAEEAVAALFSGLGAASGARRDVGRAVTARAVCGLGPRAVWRLLPS